VGDGVKVAVFVAVAVDVAVAVGGVVGVLGDRSGVFVTSMETLTRMVRALIPVIGSGGISDSEREMKGTNLGMIGKKSPLIFTWMRLELLGEKLVSGARPVQ
jgi:hypothetical protein